MQTSCSLSELQLVVAELFPNKHNQTSPLPLTTGNARKLESPALFLEAGIHRQRYLTCISQPPSKTQTPRRGSSRPLTLTATWTTLHLIQVVSPQEVGPCRSAGRQWSTAWPLCTREFSEKLFKTGSHPKLFYLFLLARKTLYFHPWPDFNNLLLLA